MFTGSEDAQLQVTPSAAEENLNAVLLLSFTWQFVFQHCRILRSLHCNVLPSMCRSDSGNSRSLGWSASSHSNFQDAWKTLQQSQAIKGDEFKEKVQLPFYYATLFFCNAIQTFIYKYFMCKI